MTAPRAPPKFLTNNPQGQKEWDAFQSRITNVKANTRGSAPSKALKERRAASKKLSSRFTAGPDVDFLDWINTGWSDTASEWTAESVTGSTTTYEDTNFSLSVGGMKVHTAYDETVIEVVDGSIPLQFYTDGSGNTDFSDVGITIAQKFNCAFYYTADSDIQFDKVIISILETDSANAATKTRLDFYKIYDEDSVIAIQLMIENVDMNSYRDTRIRFNLSALEISANGSSGRVYLSANRIPLDQTVGSFDAQQTYSWSSGEYGYGDDVVYYDDAPNNFKGWTFYRRIPYTALRLSNFFPEVTSLATTATATNKSSYLTWVTFGLVLVLFAVVIAQVMRNKY